MADLIQQDSTSIKKIAEEISSDGRQFLKLATEMFEDLEKEIGLDQSHPTWYGPKADQFIKNVGTKKEDFDKAGNNIIKMGDNLKEQAESWERFENS